MRIHEADWTCRFWRGTVNDVVSLLEAAYDEAFRRFPAHAPSVEVRVFYSDGQETFASVDSLAHGLPQQDLSKVRGINADLTVPGERTTVSVEFNSKEAVEIEVRSPDRVFAHGLADTLGAQADTGRLPPHKPHRRPLHWYELLAMTLWALGVAGCVYWLAVGTFDIPIFIMVVLLISTVTSVPLLETTDRRVLNPFFTLLRDDEPVEASEEPPPGLAMRAQDAIRKRPLLSISLTFVFGVIVNKVSELI